MSRSHEVAAVRGQDLGIVRGQPIRPILAGFSEPVTDWLFQAAMQARGGESAFAVKANKEFRAVSIMPSLKDGHPVAEITLVKGEEFKTVSEKLD